MKYILSLLITLSVLQLQAQDKTVTVSSKNQSISVVIGEEENEEKIFALNNEDLNGNSILNVRIDNKEGDKDWKRNFTIYDSVGTTIKDFLVMKNNYCIKLSELKSLLQPQQTYFIYTTAVPVDPQKAMLVKMGRQIICAIKIR